jgi:hypothetical protein
MKHSLSSPIHYSLLFSLLIYSYPHIVYPCLTLVCLTVLATIEGENNSAVASCLEGLLREMVGVRGKSRKGELVVIVKGASLAVSLYVVLWADVDVHDMMMCLMLDDYDYREGDCRERFGKLCRAADAVICCRVTPKQKADVVKLVKDSGSTTLAVGDGGNDVSMIQEAHVGVGIEGKEGLQAARAADYRVAQFMHLQRLLLIHGRYSYYRTCLVAQYSFYKSFCFCLCQVAFGFLSGFAGVSFFNRCVRHGVIDVEGGILGV